MASVFSGLRWLYHRLPATIRHFTLFERVSHWVAQRVATHSELYSARYYEDVEFTAAQSAPMIAQSILSSLQPKRVIDVGCGTGAVLAALRDIGCGCFGLEYSDAGLEMCRTRGLDVQKFDLERHNLASGVGSFDVATSMEVAEHLPKSCADRFVDLLISLAPIVVFTAATPGQGGVEHINEQPHEYWIEKYESRGYRYERQLSEEWRRQWEAAGVTAFYHRNLMIFCRIA